MHATKRLSLGLAALAALASCAPTPEPEAVKVEFPSADGLAVTADLRMAQPEDAPFIVLCHMADSSRGEYGPIVARLARLGFNTLALDQRSGNQAGTTRNETAARAREAGKPDAYSDALPDIEAGLAWARANKARGKLILWGSSYSASLALVIAGTNPGSVDAVLAFSPGEYFGGDRYVETAASHIAMPAFVTSARAEREDWAAIYAAIPAAGKTGFVPKKGSGDHGAPALYKDTSGSDEYWAAVESFLAPFGGKRVR